jgi:hypothetical protein
VQRGSASTNDKGEYKFDALTADRYIVYARCQESLPVERPLAAWRPEQIEPAESWLPVFYPDSLSPEGAQWLTVLPGSNSAGIDFHLRATPVTTLSGTLSGLGAAPPGTQPNINLFPADNTVEQPFVFGSSFDAATSTFKVMMVPPGSYRLMVVSSGTQGETLAYASLLVTVGRVRPAPLFVQMHQGLSVSGVVELPPAAGSANLYQSVPGLPKSLLQHAAGGSTPRRNVHGTRSDAGALQSHREYRVGATALDRVHPVRLLAVDARRL